MFALASNFCSSGQVVLIFLYINFISMSIAFEYYFLQCDTTYPSCCNPVGASGVYVAAPLCNNGCFTCPAGSFGSCAQGGNNCYSCNVCGSGNYSLAGASSCGICPSGTYSVSGITGKSQCSTCHNKRAESCLNRLWATCRTSNSLPLK